MITITNIPTQVVINQPFLIQGNVSDDLRGEQIRLSIDRQFNSSAGFVSDDSNWEVNFVFNSPGTRRITIRIGSESQTANIEVNPGSPSIRITEIPDEIKVLEAFTIQGQVDGLENGEELLIRIDRQFDVARPIVQDGRWSANLILNQSGNRLLEVIVSDQESFQININIKGLDLEIITRQVWGAPPTPSGLPNLNPKRITIHHTEYPTLSPNASLNTKFSRMREIRRLHVRDNGWLDFGYHYAIMPSGRVYEGRYSRKRGAHDVINDGFGVVFDGRFQLSGSRITDAAFDSAVALCTQLCQVIGITDPTTLVPTRTADFGTRSLPRIIGHRDRVNTDCPGKPNGTSVRLEEIRQAVRAALR
ncbi:MAG: peptidoglycan recognition family protein [Leptolyngbyaceae cyanobacterium MO_188.B28]|nr:peptidoglycan recognition family protein [Leptolyngbyaceae cyanobacterium MO_188.B28]